MEEKNIVEILKSALPNLNELVSADVVVGKEIKTSDGTTIIPVSKVSFGYGMGGGMPSEKTKFGGGTGGGVSVTPIGFLVIGKDGIRLMQISSADNTADRVVNMVPDVIDKIQGIVSPMMEKKAAKKAEEAVKKAEEEQREASLDDIK